MIALEERNKFPEIRFASDFEISKNAPFKTVEEFIGTMGNIINSDMMIMRVTERQKFDHGQNVEISKILQKGGIFGKWPCLGRTES